MAVAVAVAVAIAVVFGAQEAPISDVLWGGGIPVPIQIPIQRNPTNGISFCWREREAEGERRKEKKKRGCIIGHVTQLAERYYIFG